MNIVVLVVDTLRDKDIVESPEIAPFLTHKGEEGLKLDNYYSNASWTLPAHSSLFTGKLPSEHGTKTTNPFFNSENKLVELLKDKGFHTKGISENDWVSHFSGFNRGFDDFKDYNTEELGGNVWREIWVNDYQYQSRLEKWGSFLKRSLINLDYRS